MFRDAYENQQTQPIVLSYIAVNTISPKIGIPRIAQVTLRPGMVLIQPLCFQTTDGAG